MARRISLSLLRLIAFGTVLCIVLSLLLSSLSGKNGRRFERREENVADSNTTLALFTSTVTLHEEETTTHAAVFVNGSGNPYWSEPLIREDDICTTLRPGMFSLIYIHTAPAHFKRRALIRSTWGRSSLYADLRTATVFFVGRPSPQTPDADLIQAAIKAESERYGDIIQDDYADTYKNLSYKVVSAFRWIALHCPTPFFALKADDDMFVNVFNMIKHLGQVRRYVPNSTDFMCLVWYKMGVIREPKSKWFLSKQEYPDDHFPPYCSGSSFMIPRLSVHKLYNASKTAKPLWVDDAYASGILAKEAGIGHNSMASIYVLKAEDFEEKLIRGDAVFGHMPGDKGVNSRHRLWKKLLRKEELMSGSR